MFWQVNFSSLGESTSGNHIGCRRLKQVDIGVVQHVDQLDDHDCRQAPNLELAIAVAGYVKALTTKIDAVGNFSGCIEKKTQRHGKHGGNFAVVGPVFNIIRHQTDVRRDLD